MSKQNRTLTSRISFTISYNNLRAKSSNSYYSSTYYVTSQYSCWHEAASHVNFLYLHIDPVEITRDSQRQFIWG